MSSSPTTVWRRHDAMPAEGLRSAWKNIAPLKSRKLLKSIGRAATVAINISWHQVYHETSRQAFEFCRANSRPQELEAWARGDRTLENVDRTSRQEMKRKWWEMTGNSQKGIQREGTDMDNATEKITTLKHLRAASIPAECTNNWCSKGWHYDRFACRGWSPNRSGWAISCRKGNSLS